MIPSRETERSTHDSLKQDTRQTGTGSFDQVHSGTSVSGRHFDIFARKRNLLLPVDPDSQLLLNMQLALLLLYAVWLFIGLYVGLPTLQRVYVLFQFG